MASSRDVSGGPCLPCQSEPNPSSINPSAAIIPKSPEMRMGKKAISLIRAAESHAQKLGHRAIGTGDLLWAMFHDDTGTKSTAIMQLEARGISANLVYASYRYSDNAANILKLAGERANELNHVFIGTEDLLFGLFHAPQTASRSRAVEQLFQRGVTEDLVFGNAELRCSTFGSVFPRNWESAALPGE